MKSAILKPVKEIINGKRQKWLEDRNGARYEMPTDSPAKQAIANCNYRAKKEGMAVHVKVIEHEGLLKWSVKSLRKQSDWIQFNNFPELMAMKIDGPDPDNSKPNSIRDQVRDSVNLKPEELEMEDLKWKTLYHDVITAKNIMMVGPSGTGKTFAVQMMAKALHDRPYFYFNLGASQDPRTFLIGNTQFSKDDGTYFNRSAFINAITTENALILLDEISRAHPDAWNILMTVLDLAQRYVRIDEADGTPVIKVAKGVSFLATANIGNEYTATRVMDHALTERFELMEMEPLDKAGEVRVINRDFPDCDSKIVNAIAEIAHTTRLSVKNPDEDKISKILSTRSTLAIAEMCSNGFTLAEAAEVRIYPYYDNEGGADSERTFMKQLVQKYIITKDTKEDMNETFNVDSDLLDEKPWN